MDDLAYEWLVECADGRRVRERTTAEPQGQGIGPYLATARRLELLPRRPGVAPLVVTIPPGARACFWRRHQITVNVHDGTELGRTHETVAGWVRPDGVGVLLTLAADGALRLSWEGERTM